MQHRFVLRKSILVLLFLFIGACATYEKQEAPYTIAPDINNNNELAFKSRPDGLRMMVKREPLLKLYQEWIFDHPEAKYVAQDFSIPVLTDQEYALLSKYLGKERLDFIARAMYIQNSRFIVNCMGVNQKVINGKNEKQFFIVIRSDDLKDLRLVLKNEYVESGGDTDKFFPSSYTPFIPFASTKPGLNLSGPKDESSCIEKLEVEEL